MKIRGIDFHTVTPTGPKTSRPSISISSAHYCPLLQLLLPLLLPPPAPFLQTSSASSSQAAPESARGRLKSCLSSRKRPRGAASASTPGGFRSPPCSSLDSPDVTANVDDMLAATGAVLSPSSRNAGGGGWGTSGLKTPGTASGGGGAGRAPDMGMETPRRVMFGAPMAAEFNHLSPSNRLTPMPSRDAKVGGAPIAFAIFESHLLRVLSA